MSRNLAKRVVSFRGLAAGVLVVLLLLSAIPGLAQTGPETMNFQGRLLDASGIPLVEMHCLRFRLCLDGGNVETCTDTKVWPSEAPFEYHRVTPATGTYKAGLFTVTLGDPPEPDVDQPLSPDLMYDHDTLYLEMGVAPLLAEPCSDVDPVEYMTMEPRSQLRASAYAQRSRRVRTAESDNVALVEVVNTGSGGAVYGQTGSTSSGAAAGEFRALGATGQTFGVSATSTSGIGVRGIGGGSSGQGTSAKVGVWGDTSAGIGVLGYTGSTTANMAGVAGWATAASGQTYGVWGSTSSDSGYGVYGTGTEIGVRGVGGTGSGTLAGGATGVWGDSQNGTGVLGFTSSTDGQAGVAGWANAASGQAYGVYGRSLSEGGIGMYGMGPMTGTVGIATATGGTSYGVYGRNASSSGAGVYGESQHASGLGVHGHSDGSGEGVRGSSIDGNGMAGYSTAGNGIAGTSTNGHGVWGTSTNGYGVYSQGDAHVEGNLTWKTRKGYIAVGPPAFHTYATGGYTEHDVHEIGLSSLSSCAPDDFVNPLANLQLPHGATLTTMTLYWKDASSAHNIELQLARSDLAGSWDLVTIIESSGEAGTSTSTPMAIPEMYATVDNSLHSYGLRLWVYCETWVYGVVFEYEYSEPY
jgi:hypothetical protein